MRVYTRTEDALDRPAGTTNTLLNLSIDTGCCLFFFQAEDGIRDYKVTGVQTCALPILVGLYAMFLVYRGIKLLRAWRRTRTIIRGAYSVSFPDHIQKIIAECQGAIGFAQIGRASCRERV